MSEPNFQPPDDQNSTITVQDKQRPLEFPPDEPSYHPPSHHTYPPDEDFNPEPILLEPDFINTHLGKRILEKYGASRIIANKINAYGNSIILGSFCYAITFIVYGFYRAKVYTVNESFLWAMILFFGSIGQATAGFLEIIRTRHFTAFLYLTTGFYCLSHFVFYIYPRFFEEESNLTFIYYSGTVCAFYSAMVVVFFAVVMASLKSNLLLILQTLTGFVFFLLRAVGEGCGSLHTKKNAAGILQVISGFFSLLVFISQVINDVVFGKLTFNTVPMSPNNKIDPSH